MPEGTIAAYMRTDFLSLPPDRPMRAAVADLVRTGTPAAPVMDEDGRLIGILTQKDCFAAALSSAYYQQWSDVVQTHMSETVESLDAETDIVTAAEAFQRLPYRAFPVIRDGEVVGMLTRADLLTAFLDFG